MDDTGMEHSRRHLLKKTGVSLGALSFSGCLNDDEETYVEPAESPSGEHNWPMYRYDAGRTAYNPDTYGLIEEPEVEWEFERTAGSTENGLSSPIAVDGSLYFGSARPDDTFYSVNAANGGTVWEFRDFSPLRCLCEPAAYGDERVFAVDGSLWCFNPEEGDVLWDERMGGGAHQQPVFADGRIYVKGANYIHSFDVVTGDVEWRVRYENARPLAYNEGKLAVPQSRGDGLTILDAEDGSEVWSIELVITHPVVREGVVFFSKENQTLAYDIHDGSEVWSKLTGGSDVFVLTEDFVFLRDRVLDVETGEELWRYDEVGGLPRRWKGAAAGDVLYVASGTERELYAVDVEEREFLWSMEPDFTRLWEYGQPVVADGRLYISSGPELQCITGREP